MANVVLASREDQGSPLDLLTQVPGALEDVVGVRRQAVLDTEHPARSHRVQGGTRGKVNVEVANVQACETSYQGRYRGEAPYVLLAGPATPLSQVPRTADRMSRDD